VSPRRVNNEDAYHDRTVQDWHRATFCDHADAIDLDLMGVCCLSDCRRVIYMIEASTDPEKHTSILERLAEDAHTVAFLVLHRNGLVVSGWNLTDKERLSDAADVRHALAKERFMHTTRVHPEQIALLRVLERDL
jgi:hypothetical protein